MTPPATGAPASPVHSTLPSAALNASTLPLRSPVNTTPPAVGVMPASIGVGAWYFHAMLPSSALIACTQPFDVPTGSLTPNGASASASPVYGLPISPGGGLFAIRLTLAHQSTALTNNRFVAGSKAGPFHCTPPVKPGQKCVSLSENGVATFSIVVTAVL